MHDDKLCDHIHDLAKESYLYQLDRIDNVRGKILGVSRVLFVLGGSTIFLWSNYEYDSHTKYDYWFFIPLAIATLLFTFIVFSLLFCLGWGFKYYFIPDMQELHDYALRYDEYKKATKEDLDLVKDFKAHIIKEYTKGAKHNLDVNKQRTSKVLFSTQLSIVALILILFSLPNYIQKKSITDTNKTHTMSENNDKNNDAEDTNTVTNDSKPTRPTFPTGSLHIEASQRDASSTNFSRKDEPQVIIEKKEKK